MLEVLDDPISKARKYLSVDLNAIYKYLVFFVSDFSAHLVGLHFGKLRLVEIKIQTPQSLSLKIAQFILILMLLPQKS